MIKKDGTRVLFAHDHVFRRDADGRIYSTGGLPSVSWNRYLKHFDQVTVFARCSGDYISAEEKEALVVSSCESVRFEFAESVANLKAFVRGGGEASVRVAQLVSSHDAVIARLGSEFGLLAVREAKKQDKPYAIELVECPWDSYWNYGGLVPKLYAPVMYTRVRHAVQQCNHVLYVTEKFLQKRYPTRADNTASCSNVDVKKVSHDILLSRVSKIEEFKCDDKIVFSQIGSLSGRFKGIQVVIQALVIVKNILPNIQYRVLGGGDASVWRMEARKHGVDNLCFFDGTLPSGEQVYKWLDQSDIYVHPSLKEGLPRAVIEAMSRGLPVLGSRVAGIPELVPSDMLVRPGDAQTLAKKMIDLARNKKKMKVEAINNFERAKDFSSEKLEIKRLAFWQDFCQSV
ncbi:MULTISPECIES: glycosyltransferase [unclassified Halomonas]|uniref:glycosyltransferase n=1 Tax=unclassified Halomonas TaxID=2609666 RepID=UPI001C970F7E|nr:MULTISPECIES: glycosyltransferase [unclassified Halomonas]MBY5925422.1 glycosyltransferase family 4 protein [Halomonas sp. DP4Y7-2]MBY6232760.1 glycosyltransferase family 4 protein [Halomonas sp. DP4Y7-1]